MLSICIPVYNKNILALVKELYKQCTDSKILFEIICIDDLSSVHKEENKKDLIYPNVKYIELSENVGRAVIRNLLAEQASFPYLLYLDADVSICNDLFILNYLDCIKRSDQVVVGGISYPEKLTEQNKKLHFKYGRKRESLPAAVRSKNPYSSFLTGNLLIQKKLVQEIKFLSSLKEYGHEDTLFCLELKKRLIPVLHIFNPVIHEGLETNEIFIQKQLTAVKNLSVLIREGYDMDGIFIYRFYLTLKKYYLIGIFTFCFAPLQSLSKKILSSGGLNWLRLFDLLRLYELAVRLKKSK